MSFNVPETIRSSLRVPFETTMTGVAFFQPALTKDPTMVPNFADDPDGFKGSGAFVVPCKGSGPMQLGSLHPTNRDCSPPPDLTKADSIPWTTK